MTSPRTHEWAWGDVGRRTVCGIVRRLDRAQVVSDLGAAPEALRCKNCDRMRHSIGVSSRGLAGAVARLESQRIEPMIELSPGVVPGELDASERHVLEHTTGWLSRWPLYRNHFCASPGHDDWSTLERLCARGLMHITRPPSGDGKGGDTVFSATALGVAALKRPRVASAVSAEGASAEGAREATST